MKRISFLLVLSLNLFLFSCKDDKKEDEFSYNFADVEQSKAQLEDNGQQIITEVRTFKDEKALDAINSLGSLPLPESASGNIALGVIAKLAPITIKPEPMAISGAILKSTVDNPTTIQDAWENLKGTYTWNKATQSWVVTASTIVEFKFPAQKGGTVNNAVFTISSYKGSTPVSLDGYNGDLPVEIKANLKVDGTEYFSYSYAATYTTEGIPTLIESTTAFRSFVFASKLVNNNSAISINYSFKHADKIIYDFGVGVNGHFAVDQVAQAESVDQVLQSANAHFQLFNVKIAGIMDVAKIAEAEKTVYAGEDNANFDYFKADSLFAVAINKNAKLIVFFTDTKKKIADAEAYAYKHLEDYWYWDGQQYQYDTYEASDISIRFNFPDESSVDEYFSTGFADLVRDLNTLGDELKTKFGN